ncbi:hypothetical protein RI129_000536 [Pyrocoelia pectoralis]|uniref:Uncharacterized protein n=1 Tax=Pyrocoelia pectoralis TaxID=417401 RepID=A0AAN7ZNZ1_9COLE
MSVKCGLLLCAGVVLALVAKGNCEGKVTNKRSVLYGDQYDGFGNKCWGSCLSNLNGYNFASNGVYASGRGTYTTGQLLGLNTHTIQTITKAVPVPQPYAVTVTKHVPVSVPQPYPVEVQRHVAVPVAVKVPYEVPKPYPVKVTERIAYPVEKPVYVPITVTRNVPVQVPVEVLKPYPVKVTEHVPYPVQRNVYVKVPEPVIVPQPYAVNVPTTVFVKGGIGGYGLSGINGFGSSGLSSGRIHSFSTPSRTYLPS